MRTVNSLLILTVLLVLLGIENSFGEIYYEYEVFADSDFSHIHNVCIDPGHGGPYAEKYWNNGDGAGTHGCCYGLSEQWVNLHVAYALSDSLYP
jgi:hypothetical protein